MSLLKMRVSSAKYLTSRLTAVIELSVSTVCVQLSCLRTGTSCAVGMNMCATDRWWETPFFLGSQVTVLRCAVNWLLTWQMCWRWRVVGILFTQGWFFTCVLKWMLYLLVGSEVNIAATYWLEMLWLLLDAVWLWIIGRHLRGEMISYEQPPLEYCLLELMRLFDESLSDCLTWLLDCFMVSPTGL